MRTRIGSILGIVALAGLAAPASSRATTIVVNDSGDGTHACATTGTGTCTLRDAMTFADMNPGADAIHFAIPGAGVQTIHATTFMPAVTDPAGVTIDGYTQPGASPNTLVRGNDAVLLVEVDASGVPSGPTGMFNLMSGSSTLRGLVINRYAIDSCIAVFGDANVIEGNFIGTDPTGTAAAPGRSAIYLGGTSNRLGGSDPASRNLLVSDSLNVVELVGSSNIMQGNYVGTNRDGTASLGPFFHGIAVEGDGNTIGGFGPGQGNLVSGNGTMLGSGIIVASSDNLVAGNLIGTDRDGASPVPNGGHGVIVIENTSNNLITANTIAFNGTSGVQIGQLDESTTSFCRVSGNRIFGNGGLGIDIGDDGPLVNDSQDADTGANGLQNDPVLASASSDGVRTRVAGTLNSAPGTAFVVEFFGSPQCDPSGHGQGQFFLGARTVTTDGNGDVTFDVTLPAGAQGVVAATATDPNGNTSEFSACVDVASQVVSALPPLGPEFPVNAATAGVQYRLAVAEAAAGDFLVAWTDQVPGDIAARRFDKTGAPSGGQFVVNTTTSGQQWDPAVAADELGFFTVVWSSDGNDGDGFDVRGQRFNPAGTPIGGEFLVNQYTSGIQQGPAIGIRASGDFVVSWWSEGQDGSEYGVFARRYGSDGSALGDEFQVNTYTTQRQMAPSVAVADSGDFVVAWQSLNQDGAFDGIFAQRFDPAGAPQGDEFPVNQLTAGEQAVARVAVQPSGDFVVVWTSDAATDGSLANVAARRYDAAGSPLGGEFEVNSYTTGYQGFPSVAADAGGDFVVTWHSYQDGDAAGVFGRTLTPSARPAGRDFQINAYTTGIQAESHVAMNPAGNFVVAWRSLSQDGDNYGVFARRGELKAAQPMRVDAHGDGASSNLNGVLEPGETAAVEPAWKDTTFTPMTLTGTASNLTGPAGPTYTLDDGTADYGTVPRDAISSCYDATPGHDCYRVTVSGARPSAHWDATLDEALTGFTTVPGIVKVWTLHVGGSFSDVAPSDPFYPFVETLLHHEVTAGCGGGAYCPSASVNRAQMAVFLLKAEHGATFVPPACAGVFADVPCPSPFADWVEQLFHEGITGGCGGGNYCPSSVVTRAQMAVFLLKAEHGATFAPPACTGVFADVACPGGFAVDYVEALAAEAVTAGCGGGNFCPDGPSTRAQMAVFLVRTFGLLLYGP